MERSSPGGVMRIVSSNSCWSVGAIKIVSAREEEGRATTGNDVRKYLLLLIWMDPNTQVGGKRN